MAPQFELGEVSPTLETDGERLAQRVLYEAETSGKLKGNDVIIDNLPIMNSYIIGPDGSGTEQIAQNLNNEDLDNKRVLADLMELGTTKAAFVIFTELYGNPTLEQRLSQVDVNKTGLMLYGTSGTEENPKELFNVIAATHYLDESLQKEEFGAVGVYFVEDQGHPFKGTVDAESFFYEGNLVELGISPEEAEDRVNLAMSLLYCPKTGHDNIYHPNSKYVQNVLEYVPDNQKIVVEREFEKLYKASDEVGNQMDVSAINIHSPNPEKVRAAMDLLQLHPVVANIHINAAEYIHNNPELFPDASIADYKTIVQGVLILIAAQQTYGINDMPLIIPAKWSDMCKITGVKSNFTIEDASKDLIRGPEQGGKVLGAACPVTREEVFIYADGTTNGNEGPFSVIARVVNNMPLSEWVYGGNSGKLYYRLMNRMFENLAGGIFFDNYEKNGPHIRCVDDAKIGKNNLYPYAPHTRFWVAHHNIIPQYKDKNHPDASLGMAIPSTLALHYLLNLADNGEDIYSLLRIAMTLNGPGLENRNASLLISNLGARIVDMDNDVIYILEEGKDSYEFIRDTENIDELITFVESNSQLIGLETLTEFQQVIENTLGSESDLGNMVTSLIRNLQEQGKFELDIHTLFERIDNLRNNELRNYIAIVDAKHIIMRRMMLEKLIEYPVAQEFFKYKDLSKVFKNGATNRLLRVVDAVEKSSEIVIVDDGSTVGQQLNVDDYNAVMQKLFVSIGQEIQGEVRIAINKLENKTKFTTAELNEIAIGYFFLNGNLDEVESYIASLNDDYEIVKNNLRTKLMSAYPSIDFNNGFANNTKKFIIESLGLKESGLIQIVPSIKSSKGKITSVTLNFEQIEALRKLIEEGRRNRTTVLEKESVDSMSNTDVFAYISRIEAGARKDMEENTSGELLNIFKSIKNEVIEYPEILALDMQAQAEAQDVYEYLQQEQSLQTSIGNSQVNLAKVKLDIESQYQQLLQYLRNLIYYSHLYADARKYIES